MAKRARVPDTHDPDCGNVYKSLKFPKDVYEDIASYQEEKARKIGSSSVPM
jgi:hypothetical protein